MQDERKLRPTDDLIVKTRQELHDLRLEHERLQAEYERSIKENIRLRTVLNGIQEQAYEDIRNGLADGTSLFQIEADARAALEGKG